MEEKSYWATLRGIAPWSTLRALTARVQNWLAYWTAWVAGYVCRSAQPENSEVLPVLYYNLQYDTVHTLTHS